MTRYVISHTGKKGGPWEDAMTGRAGTPTQRLASAAFDVARGELNSLLVLVRVRHPHAKVFRLVRRSPPSLTAEERAVVEAADYYVARKGSVAEYHAESLLDTAVRALRAKRGG
jgi:hypothetical protein